MLLCCGMSARGRSVYSVFCPDIRVSSLAALCSRFANGEYRYISAECSCHGMHACINGVSCIDISTSVRIGYDTWVELDSLFLYLFEGTLFLSLVKTATGGLVDM